MATLSFPDKDPDEVLDYVMDWAARLVSDTISTSTWAVASGAVEIESSSSTATTATTWLSGGVLNTACVVTNQIVTAGGRTMEQSARIKIRAK